jgi:aryl-alcohol dehydrogenase-like predicted oxidoreductase
LRRLAERDSDHVERKEVTMPRRYAIPGTDLEVTVLCLGGNVFGWTADARESARVLDRFVDGGGNFIDTADVYSAWVPGHAGGESELAIGHWLAGRSDREKLVVGTKVGQKDGLQGLSAKTIVRAAEESMRRLSTEYIDILWAHGDDEATPQEETLAAFGTLIEEGKVRAIGASNFSAERLESALGVSDRDGLPGYQLVQPHYNLMERDYESDLAPTVAQHGLLAVPYLGLASGFLTGKYRPGGDSPTGPRAERAAKYLDAVGESVLRVLDDLAARHETSVAAVALAWLAAQPTVLSPIASARSVEQLNDLLDIERLELTPTEIHDLATASAGRETSAGA